MVTGKPFNRAENPLKRVFPEHVRFALSRFLAHSASYICSDPNKIFVFGGYSIEGEFKNYGFVLRVDHS